MSAIRVLPRPSRSVAKRRWRAKQVRLWRHEERVLEQRGLCASPECFGPGARAPMGGGDRRESAPASWQQQFRRPVYRCGGLADDVAGRVDPEALRLDFWIGPGASTERASTDAVFGDLHGAGCPRRRDLGEVADLRQRTDVGQAAQVPLRLGNASDARFPNQPPRHAGCRRRESARSRSRPLVASSRLDDRRSKGGWSR